MSNTNETAEVIFKKVTRNGQVRYYRYGRRPSRLFPMGRAEAELALSTGAAVLGDKPYWER